MSSHQEGNGITSITQDTTMNLIKIFMELRPTHTMAMLHQSTIVLSCIPISCQHITNHPIMFHTHSYTKLINSSPIVSYRMHTRHHTPLYKVTTNQSLETHTNQITTVNLAQARGTPRSSYQIPLGRDCEQWARRGLAQARGLRLG